MAPEDPGTRDQLDGWKEIADYVRRSVRTAQRWERRYRLPIHRVEATGGEVVYAFRAEIDDWRRRKRQSTLPVGKSSSNDVGVEHALPAVTRVPPTTLPVPLAGAHLYYVLLQAGLYGFMVAEGLMAEMAYAFGRDGTLALRLAPIVFVWSGTCVVIACWVDIKLIRAGRPHAALWSFGVFAGAMAIMLVGLLPWLPPDSTIQATFQTRTIQSGYLKNALYYFLPLFVVFVLPTFHAVVALEREANIGDRRNLARLIHRNSRSVPLAGVLFPRISHLSVILIVTVLWAIVSTNYLLDRLIPGPYMNLFSILVEVRVATWFVIALTAVIWYSSRLGNLQRTITADAASTTL